MNEIYWFGLYFLIDLLQFCFTRNIPVWFATPIIRFLVVLIEHLVKMIELDLP